MGKHDGQQSPAKGSKANTGAAAASGADEGEADSRSAEIAKFWSDLDIEVVQLSLPGKTGYTLRHYRTVTVIPDELLEEDELSEGGPERELTDAELAEIMDAGDAATDDQATKASAGPREPEEREDVVFLAQHGSLLMFHSAEGLVEFVKSNQPNDLRDVGSYSTLRKEITPELVVPSDDDRYRLTGVVQNLRDGHKEWNDELLINAGEIARDIAHACRLTTVLKAVSPGSPLDDLDENLRSGGFLARRRLRRIGVEQAALAWRSVIGKISGVIEWRD